MLDFVIHTVELREQVFAITSTGWQCDPKWQPTFSFTSL